MRLTTLRDARESEGAALIFAMLAGAAIAVLLIACANVASLELAAASRSARGQAVQTALGASHGSLARIVCLEAGLLLVISAVIAVPLAFWGTSVLSDNLTVEMRTALTNPLDLDVRAIGFMLAIAAAALLVTSVPSLRRLARLSILDALRDDGRVMPITRRAARTRQLLMGSQVALTVLLLAGSLLLIRTYLGRVRIDRGFDGTGVVTIEVGPADDAPRRGAELESVLLERLRATSGVRSVARTQLLPPSTEAGITAKLQIGGRARESEFVMLASYAVDPEYFDTVGISIVEGRPLTPFGPRDEVIVNEAFARRFWPNGGGIGAWFDMQGAGMSGVSVFQIVGIARDFRQDRQTRETGEAVYVMYMRLSPTSAPLRFVARLEGEGLLPAVTSMVRSIAERSVVRTETMATRYARLDADKQLAALITTGFGLLALVVATAGIYSVTAFFVSSRSREIGIRMALGADRGTVQRLVFRSSMIAVINGAVIGVAAARLASGSIASQLYGVKATDPSTYAVICGLIVATAIAATWLPARRASNLDPAVTLRAE
jgi:putative ABC transport system permease protein